MDRYLLDGQEKCLKDEAELEKALKHYEDTDRWYFPRANEIYAKGVDNTPLFYGDYMRSISATCSEELFEECVKSTGIFLKVPDTILKDGYNTFAVREIALESVLERAGVACRLMRTLTDTGCVKALDAEKRGGILDIGFRHSSEPIKVLVSDGKISIIGSSKYAILDYREGLEAAKREIENQDDFDELSFRNALISHEGLIVRYDLTGSGPDSHKAAMEEANIHAERYEFVWSSSHTKCSCMIGRMNLVVGGTSIPIGKPVKVRHMGSTSQKLMEAFRRGVSRLGAALKENEDLIESLGNIIILHSKGCLTRVLERCNSIPASEKKAAIDAIPDIPVTGMDVYLAAARAAEKVTGIQNTVSAMEEVAQIQYLNFSAMDKPVEKDN